MSENAQALKEIGIRAARILATGGDPLLAANLFMEARKMALRENNAAAASVALGMMANAYVIAGDVESAQKCLRQGIRESPDSWALHVQLAMLWRDKAEGLRAKRDARARRYYRLAEAEYNAARARADTEAERREMAGCARRMREQCRAVDGK